jgi:hypothetical protein
MRRLALSATLASILAANLAGLALTFGLAMPAAAGMVIAGDGTQSIDLPDGQRLTALRIRTGRNSTTLEAHFAPSIDAFPVMRPEDDEAFEIADDFASELPDEDAPPLDDDGEEMLSRGAVRDSLHEQGFSEIDHLRRRGRVYVAEVTGPEGDRMRVVINGETGDLAGLRVLDRADEDRRAELDFLED